MKKRGYMTEHFAEPKRKGAGLRQFVFAMMISTIASLAFFPSGRLATGPVTNLMIELVDQWRDAVARSAHVPPHASLR